MASVEFPMAKPIWVAVAEDIVVDTEESSPARHSSGSGWPTRWELVSTYTREEAGFTCQECAQPFRMWHERQRMYSKYGDHDQWVTFYTVRCTECARLMKRWQRAKTKAERLTLAAKAHKLRLSFVTLTLPNYECSDPQDGVRDLKLKVAAFREHHVGIEGGYDFYEWTGSEGDWNIHHHGIWVMDYWDQASMQKAWSHGIVHVKRLKKRYAEQDCVRYATKYASKTDVKGIRLSQGFGCLYGSAWVAVETYLANAQSESSTVAGAAESLGNEGSRTGQ